MGEILSVFWWMPCYDISAIAQTPVFVDNHNNYDKNVRLAAGANRPESRHVPEIPTPLRHLTRKLRFIPVVAPLLHLHMGMNGNTKNTENKMDKINDERRERMLRELAQDLSYLVESGDITDEQANEWYNMKADQWNV